MKRRTSQGQKKTIIMAAGAALLILLLGGFAYVRSSIEVSRFAYRVVDVRPLSDLQNSLVRRIANPGSDDQYTVGDTFLYELGGDDAEVYTIFLSADVRNNGIFTATDFSFHLSEEWTRDHPSNPLLVDTAVSGAVIRAGEEKRDQTYCIITLLADDLSDEGLHECISRMRGRVKYKYFLLSGSRRVDLSDIISRVANPTG